MTTWWERVLEALGRFVLLAVLAGLAFYYLGCALIGARGQVYAQPGQGEAVAIIWVSTYGRTDAPPAVRWVTGAELTCTDPNSGRPGFKCGTDCREGCTVLPTEVSVAWREGDRYSTTTLAHELMHVRLARMGILDPNHTREDWRAVDAANAALESAGL